jgi:hypothetical protein
MAPLDDDPPAEPKADGPIVRASPDARAGPLAVAPPTVAPEAALKIGLAVLEAAPWGLPDGNPPPRAATAAPATKTPRAARPVHRHTLERRMLMSGPSSGRTHADRNGLDVRVDGFGSRRR